MTAPSWLEIDLSGLDHNLSSFNQLLSTNGHDAAGVCAVVKADAYGLGATHIARRLIDHGVAMLGVYTTDQARQLVQAGIVGPILVLMPVQELSRSDVLYRTAVSGRLHLTVHSIGHLTSANRLGQTLGCRLPIHLHVDTGMSRSGLTHDQTADALIRLGAMRGIRLAGIYTHMATADDDVEFADEQLERFDSLIENASGRLGADTLIHMANTFATLRSARFHRSMVRIGLGLLGYGDTIVKPDPAFGPIAPLRPIVRWVSGVVHVQAFPKDATVGYGRTHRLQRDSVLGVVPVGYADGYPMALGNESIVMVLSAGNVSPLPAPVVGRVSMDQIVIDLTDYPGITTDFGTAEDLSVELISDDPSSACSLPALADQAGSSCYELLCRLSSRLPRTYKYAASAGELTSQSQPTKQPIALAMSTR